MDKLDLPENDEEESLNEELEEGLEGEFEEELEEETEEDKELAKLLKEEYEMDDNVPLFADDEPEADKYLSTFEKEQLKMTEQIKEFEQDLVAKKDWTLSGEANSKQRPKNSLLEQDLDVEIASKPPPVITEETTKTLEEIIIQRIKDEAFDDVVRKMPPKDSAYDPNRRWELNDEKSKKSLAEIYEDEYTKTQATKTVDEIAVQEKHDEINQLMGSLISSLDALSNWHYTPKRATLEIQVVPNADASAIMMEEFLPLNYSTEQSAIPSEVFKGQVRKSKAELDQTDKKRNLKKSKRKAGLEIKEKETLKKLKSGGETHEVESKKKAIKELMKQKNVTLVVDGKDRKDYKKASANVVEKGDKIQKETKKKAKAGVYKS
jgi:U3 small nucleolar RNA-associated protein MPP10